MSIEFNCESCGKHYKVPDTMAGKRAKCKGCGQVIQVPSRAEDPPMEVEGEGDVSSPPPAAPPKVPASQRPADAKPSVQSPAAAAQCPSCQASLAPGAVLCINCGFDLRKGVKIAGVADNDGDAEQADDSAADSDRDSEQGSSADKGKQPKWWRFWSKKD